MDDSGVDPPLSFSSADFMFFFGQENFVTEACLCTNCSTRFYFLLFFFLGGRFPWFSRRGSRGHIWRFRPPGVFARLLFWWWFDVSLALGQEPWKPIKNLSLEASYTRGRDIRGSTFYCKAVYIPCSQGQTYWEWYLGKFKKKPCEGKACRADRIRGKPILEQGKNKPCN